MGLQFIVSLLIGGVGLHVGFSYCRGPVVVIVFALALCTVDIYRFFWDSKNG